MSQDAVIAPDLMPSLQWLNAEPQTLLGHRGRVLALVFWNASSAYCHNLIDELAREGLAVLLISSELDELLDGADRLVVLRDGEVAGELEGAQLTREHVLKAIAAEVMDDAASHQNRHQNSR